MRVLSVMIFFAAQVLPGEPRHAVRGCWKRARLRPLSAPHRSSAGHPAPAVPTVGGPVTARIGLKGEPFHPGSRLAAGIA
jgi:hypothetical protein